MPLTRDASVTELFLELVAVPSPSRRERVVGELIREWLAGHGVAAQFDDAGAVNGSDAGNLVATVPGASGAPDYLFVAHVDTVERGAPAVTPHVDDDGIIRSDGETILGADNKAAVAAVMRVCAAAAQLPEAWRPIFHAAFTCCEESGRMGAGLLAPELLERVDCAFPSTAPARRHRHHTRAGPDVVRVRGPRAGRPRRGQPRGGVSAIAVAAEIITALPLGRRPGGGSVNIAAIVGGSIFDRLTPEVIAAGGVESALHGALTNSIPDRALVRGEVRGYSVEEIEGAVAAIDQTIAASARRAAPAMTGSATANGWCRHSRTRRSHEPGARARRRRPDPGAGARPGGAPGHAGGHLPGGGHRRRRPGQRRARPAPGLESSRHQLERLEALLVAILDGLGPIVAG